MHTEGPTKCTILLVQLTNLYNVKPIYKPLHYSPTPHRT
uniref:Uncharacterized protein n=1 Tax=Arundo donax TaxID=35708 RepID=A0A0A9BXH8_ARUDO